MSEIFWENRRNNSIYRGIDHAELTGNYPIGRGINATIKDIGCGKFELIGRTGIPACSADRQECLSLLYQYEFTAIE